ncbi:hypothetical protein ACFL5O_08075 [Myxococcota bacterium]
MVNTFWVSFPPERRALIDAVKQARYRVDFDPGVLWAWEDAMTTFLQSEPHDKDALLQVLLTVR